MSIHEYMNIVDEALGNINTYRQHGKKVWRGSEHRATIANWIKRQRLIMQKAADEVFQVH